MASNSCRVTHQFFSALVRVLLKKDTTLPGTPVLVTVHRKRQHYLHLCRR
jgi:hypothetical protein